MAALPSARHDACMDLSHIARREVFSAAWAKGHGLDSDALTRAVAHDAACRLFHGWYSTRRPTDDTDWNRIASRAAYLHFDGRAMVSHQSALVWAGLPVCYADLRTVHLTRAIAGSSRSRPPLKLHRAIPGLPVRDRVPLAVAVVQAGLTGQPLTALVAADAALHAGKIDQVDLDEALDLLALAKGIGPVRAILSQADERIESPGESIIGHRLRQLGWEVVPQFRVVTDQGVKYADFLIKGTRVLVEFDGLVKYRGADGADAVVAEKQREDALRREGHGLARFVWSEVDDLALIEARITEQTRSAAA